MTFENLMSIVLGSKAKQASFTGNSIKKSKIFISVMTITFVAVTIFLKAN